MHPSSHPLLSSVPPPRSARARRLATIGAGVFVIIVVMVVMGGVGRNHRGEWSLNVGDAGRRVDVFRESGTYQGDGNRGMNFDGTLDGGRNDVDGASREMKAFRDPGIHDGGRDGNRGGGIKLWDESFMLGDASRGIDVDGDRGTNDDGRGGGKNRQINDDGILGINMHGVDDRGDSGSVGINHRGIDGKLGIDHESIEGSGVKANEEFFQVTPSITDELNRRSDKRSKAYENFKTTPPATSSVVLRLPNFADLANWVFTFFVHSHLPKTKMQTYNGGGVHPARTGGPFSFQMHSINDVREWLPLYLKGARSFKIDPHHIRLPSKQLDSLFLKNVTKLVFSHDSPVLAKNSKKRYHTFADLLKELNLMQGDLGRVLKRDRELGRSKQPKLRIQLCFKSAPDLCVGNSTHKVNQDAKLFIDLVDDFYHKSESLDDYVEFILDGGGKPFKCAKWKWRRWSSVWISDDRTSPASALTNANEVNDNADNSRFVVLNNPVSLSRWEKLASMNFGRFASERSPYQLWEPADQLTIVQYARLFAQVPYHAAGFHFVSNSDPTMIALYSGAHGSINYPIAIGANSKDLSCPLGVLHAWGFDLVFYRRGASFFQVAISKADSETRGVFRTQTLDLPMIGVTTWTRVSGVYGEIGRGTLSDSTQGWFCSFTIARLDGTVTMNLCHRAPKPYQAARCIVVSPIKASTKRLWKEDRRASSLQLPWIVIHKETFATLWTRLISAAESPAVATSSSTTPPVDPLYKNCAVLANLFSVITKILPGGNDAHVKNKTEIEIINHQTYCLRGKTDSPNPVLAMDGDVVETSSTGIVMVVFSDAGRKVYGSLWNVEDAAGVDDEHSTILVDFKSMGVGSMARLISERDVVALVLGDSYCFNCVEHNKRASPLLCDSVPVSTRGVVTYTVGTEHAWKDFFLKRNELRQLSACDPNLLHGSLDLGTCPSVALRLSMFSSTGILRKRQVYKGTFIEAHKSVDDFKPTEKGIGCGASMWINSIVMNRFTFYVDSKASVFSSDDAADAQKQFDEDDVDGLFKPSGGVRFFYPAGSADDSGVAVVTGEQVIEEDVM